MSGSVQGSGQTANFRKALYPGTFDPPHCGHEAIIRRAAAQVDHLIVGIATNPEKRPYLSEQQRITLLRQLCSDLPNVSFATYHGATVTFARAQQCSVLIRGLRHASDLEAEFGIAQINRQHGLDSLFLLADASHVHVSSRLVKQVVAAGLSVDGLVAAPVAAAISAVSATTVRESAGG